MGFAWALSVRTENKLMKELGLDESAASLHNAHNRFGKFNYTFGALVGYSALLPLQYLLEG